MSKDKKKIEEEKIEEVEEVIENKPEEKKVTIDNQMLTINDFIYNFKATSDEGAKNPFAAAFRTWWKFEGFKNEITDEKQKLKNPMSYKTNFNKWEELYKTCMNKEIK